MAGIGRTLAAATGLLGALLGSQGPEYAQQYRQRLGGAIDELRIVVDRFDGQAAAFGVNRVEAIARLEGNPDPIARAQADQAMRAQERLSLLYDHQARFNAAGPFGRLAVLVVDADPLIARRAYEDFEPAMPVTVEGAVAAGIGFVALWSLTLALVKTPAILWRRRRQRRLAAAPPTAGRVRAGNPLERRQSRGNHPS